MKKLPIFLATALAVGACGPSVATLTIDPATLTLGEKGASGLLKAEPKDKKGELVVNALTQVQWTSSDPSVATVVAGKVSAVKSGETNVTAAVAGKTATAKVTVSIPAAITLDPPGLELNGIGTTADVKADVKDEAGKPVAAPKLQWSTTDGKVAIVEDGKVTATGAGNAIVSASFGELKGQINVVVKMPMAANLTVEPAKHTFAKAGETVKLMAKATDEANQPINGQTFTFTSSDEKVATVTPDGTVTAVKKGKAKIKVAAGEKTTEVDVDVKK